MADYKLQARVPQETADKLFQVIKELQEVTEVADVTTSSITRAALEGFIKDHNNKNVKIEIDNSLLTNDVMETVCNEFKNLIDKSNENSPVRKVYCEIYFALLSEQVNKLKMGK